MRGPGNCAAVSVLIAFLLAGCLGEDPEGHYQLSVALPGDWESLLDMEALSAPTSTPYIGTVRLIVEDGSSVETKDFPWQSGAASVALGGTGTLTIQAITAGQVIMEGQAEIKGGSDAELTVPLVPSGGFSRAGTLLHPRQRQSVVAAGTELYVLGGTPETGVIEVLAPDGDGFATTAWAASLVYPRVGQEAVYDAAGNRIFVFKGADPDIVGDDVYEVVDLRGTVAAYLLDIYRVGFTVATFPQNVFLIGGYDSATREMWRIDSSNMDFSLELIDESLLPLLGFYSERKDTNCLSVSEKLACIGGQQDLNYLNEVVIFNTITESILGSTNLPNGKIGATVTQINSDEAILTGGLGQSGYLQDSDTLNVNTKSVISSSNIKVPRAFHTATLIDTDKLLIVGGGPTTETATSAEILDLTTGQSTLLPWRMRIPRGSHAAVPLSDGSGRVLIVGGNMGNGLIEVWNPPREF